MHLRDFCPECLQSMRGHPDDHLDACSKRWPASEGERLRSIEAAARELLAALPRCDYCDEQATHRWFGYGGETEHYCGSCARERKVCDDEHAAPWVAAARELAARLGGGG